MFTSDLKGSSLTHLSTAEIRQNEEVYTESSLLNDGNHWFLYCIFICILACLFKHWLYIEICLFLNENLNAIGMRVLKYSFHFYSSICYHSLNVLLAYWCQIFQSLCLGKDSKEGDDNLKTQKSLVGTLLSKTLLTMYMPCFNS